MLSLINIRSKFLLRNKCGVFFTYFFLPILSIIGFFFLIRGNEKIMNLYHNNDNHQYSFITGKNFLFKNEYKILGNYLNDMSLLVDNENDCNSLGKFVKDETGVELICIYSKDEIVNGSIKFKNNKNKYEFELIGLRIFFFTIFDFLGIDSILTDYIIDIFSINYLKDSNITINNSYIFFLELSSLLSKYLIKMNTNTTINKYVEITTGNNAYPPYRLINENFNIYPFILFGFIICLDFSIYTYFFIIRIIDEKEKKLRIFLEREGISITKYNLSWFFLFLFVSIIPFLTFIIILFIILRHHYILILFDIILFILNLFSITLFFSSIFSSVKKSESIIKFYNFGSTFLGCIIAFPITPKYMKILFAFIPQINFYICSSSILKLMTFQKLSWDIIRLKSHKTKISYLDSILIYISSSILYIFIGLFFQLYQRSGLKFSLFIKSFFVSQISKIDLNNIGPLLNENEEKENDPIKCNHQQLSLDNQKIKEENKFLKLVNVTKYYNNIKVIDNFNVELFPNEIFCLLGNNGAGKSTLINMISGIETPNEGDIFLNGISLITNKPYLFKNIGLCQQENIFFDYLTVKEHLKYMCQIKGNAVNNKQIETLVKKINLIEKKDSLCSTLSGGQKRKLCVALALIGESKIVLLDEPTSGMDIMSKRELWKFLKDYKKDKIIILTTHSLDEAEYLGDRIGIIYNGNFICSGTSSYLKSKYPCGFNINIIGKESVFNEKKKQDLLKALLICIPDIRIRVNSKRIFAINIPFYNDKIEDIFDIIENSKEKYEILDYTISSTSLEDVFLKITDIDNRELFPLNYYQKEGLDVSLISLINENIVHSTGFWRHLISQLKRNIYPLRRNIFLLIIELISGLGCLYIFIFGFILNNIFYYMKYFDIRYNVQSVFLDLNKILEANSNYVYEFKEGYLKKSCLSHNIKFKNLLKKPNNIMEFMKDTYDNSLANIAKQSIFLDKIENNDSKIFDVYISQIYIGSEANILANTMLFISAFLKNEYNINASILTKFQFSENIKEIQDKNLEHTNLFVISCVYIFSNIIGFLIYFSGLIQAKIKERITNIKHLLYLSGCNMWSYWIAFFLIDYLKLMILNALLFLSIRPFYKYANYFCINNISISISSLIFIYFCSFLFSKEESGSKFVILLFFIFILAFIIYSLINIIYIGINDKDSNNKEDRNSIFVTHYFAQKSFPEIFYFFAFTPVTSLLLSYFQLFFDIMKINIKEEINIEKNIYINLIIQFINFIFYSILLILTEYGIFLKFTHYLRNIFCCINKKEDHINNSELNKLFNEEKNSLENNLSINNAKNSDNNQINFSEKQLYNNPLNNPFVINEIERTEGYGNLSSKIKGLRIIYFVCCGKNVKAINNLYLGIESNEKFGLLGYNGSGKTTTFKAITNDIIYDSGEIFLFGKDNKKQFNKIRKRIGYCPQTNPLFDFMKVKEILKFYLQLKTSEETVISVSQKFNLEKYLDTYCIHLSGGNKRKLSLAISLMNKPSLLLLDEPSTGVDPLSKRKMWKNINELSKDGNIYNMILTTHSIEEAEILCDRVSWLERGNFACIGNPEQLKLQYSHGYNLHIKFDDSIINSENNLLISNEEIQKSYETISSLVLDFEKYYDFILNNPKIVPYLRFLIDIIKEKINQNTNKIILNEIRKDFSFELKLEIKPDQKHILFIQILNLSHSEPKISEILINLEPLENILIALKKNNI